jgi:PAS domain S-box-containing protein
VNISTLTNKINKGYPSPLKVLVMLATVIFVVELSIMLFFDYWPLGSTQETLIDATALTSIILPILYLFSYRPFLHHVKDLKSAEEELLQFATAIDQGMEIIIIAEPTGKITYINPTGRTVTRLSWDETIGKTVNTLAANCGKNHLYAKFSAAIGSGKEYTGEFTIETDAGKLFYGVARIHPIKSATGDTTNFVCVGRDVTAETLALQESELRERELKESEERWRLLSDMAPDPIIVHDGSKIIYANKAVADMLRSNAPVNLLGAALADLIHPDSIELLSQRVAKMKKEGLPLSEAEYKVIRFDKAVIDISASAAPITYDGKPAFQVIMRDITQRKLAETELRNAKETAEAATKMKDKFVSLVSHDLKEPLTSILGFVQLVKAEEASKISGQSISWLDIIELSGKKISAIIEELLNTTTLRTGKITPVRMFLDAHSMVSDVVAAFDFKANLKGVTVANDVPRKTRVFTDKTLFEQVIQNILSNAIKFSKSGDTVRIYVPEGRPSTIAIADTGQGVKPEFINDLFKYDKRTSSHGTQGETGTGLGLPFVNEIMAVHGGEINLETSLGKGSTFFVSFPNIKPVILLVEDNLSMTKLVQYLLSPASIEFEAAIDGDIALQKITEKKPDLVITDLNMPGINGFELIKRLKSSDTTANIPILVLTSAGKEEREKVLQLGADDFLSKSAVESDLVLRVRKIIN